MTASMIPDITVATATMVIMVKWVRYPSIVSAAAVTAPITVNRRIIIETLAFFVVFVGCRLGRVVLPGRFGCLVVVGFGCVFCIRRS